MPGLASKKLHRGRVQRSEQAMLKVHFVEIHFEMILKGVGTADSNELEPKQRRDDRTKRPQECYKT